jgi:hypothetical protein
MQEGASKTRSEEWRANPSLRIGGEQPCATAFSLQSRYVITRQANKLKRTSFLKKRSKKLLFWVSLPGDSLALLG